MFNFQIWKVYNLETHWNGSLKDLLLTQHRLIKECIRYPIFALERVGSVGGCERVQIFLASQGFMLVTGVWKNLSQWPRSLKEQRYETAPAQKHRSNAAPCRKWRSSTSLSACDRSVVIHGDWTMTWFSSPSTTSQCCPYSQTSSKRDLKFFSHKDLIMIEVQWTGG